ncbi:MAG: DUF167 family protein [Thiogranum sp.]
MPQSWYCWQGELLILDIRVQPGASRDEITGPVGDRLKIRLTTPPVDGKANKHLLAFLAKQCGVGKSRVELLSGAGARNKRVGISRPARLPEGVGAPEP